MPKIPQDDVTAILELTRKPLAAETAPEFFSAVRDSFDSLRGRLLSGRGSQAGLRALQKALNDCPGLRQRRVLNICCAPIFDKPALPAGAPDALPEFLWLFCLPFTVQFTTDQVRKGLTFPSECFDATAVLRRALQAGYFNDKAMLSGFPTLLARDDLAAMGPWNLATFFIEAEFGGKLTFTPPARQLDAEIESGRVLTLYMVAAARLTAGERQLFKEGAVWPAEDLARIVAEGLERNGFGVEKVTGHPATSVTESLLRCSQAGAHELQSVMELGKEHYGIKEVVLLQSLDGMADLTGIDEDGEEYVLCLPFSFAEPWSAVRQLGEMASQQAGLSFKSASLAIPTSSMTH